jgi:polar amino acid transport system substrate-binding protein
MREKIVIAFWVFTTALGFGSSIASAQTVPGPFTDAQVQSGQSAYTSYCASCHGVGLNGTGNFPALTGKAFVSEWGGRTTHDLYEKIRGTMPYCAGGTLDDNSYVAIVALILKANGAATGDHPFTTDTSVTISTLIK